VTRELKLALIFGFVIVLFVTVLVSDHLSQARRAQLAATVQDTPRGLDAQPAPWTPMPELAPSSQPIAALPPVQEAAPEGVREPLGEAGADSGLGALASGGTEVEEAPVLIAQGTGAREVGEAREAGANPHESLLDQATRLGMQIRERADGLTELTPPPAALRTGTERNAGDRAAGERVTARDSTAPAPTNPAPTREVSVRTHRVASGESLAKIAARYYGEQKHWRALAQFNGMTAETVLKVGAEVKVPELAALTGRPSDSPRVAPTPEGGRGTPARREATPAPAPREQRVAEAARRQPEATPARGGREAVGRTYTVRRGDTLGEIAQRELGTSRRARDILALNNLSDAGSIRVGQVLKMPGT
jgi:nucleoid-associated protein YgaU